MIKLMLMLLVTEGLDAGSWTLETPVSVSRHAEQMGGTQVYLNSSEHWPLGHLMKAVAVASANDAAMAVAEGLWGSEEAYLERVNERAQELDMAHTEFHSVHGLPPSKGEEPDRTTARDMALLGRACMTHDTVRAWVSMKELVFREGSATEYNTNKLLWRMDDCDGLKTGYIRAAGYCVTATAQRNGLRLICVVMGHPNNTARFKLAEDLLNEGFESVKRARLVSREETVGPTVQVSNCETTEVKLNVEEDIWVTAKATDIERMEIEVVAPSEITAPQQVGASLGEVRVMLDGAVIDTSPLVLPMTLEEAGWMRKIQTRVKTFFGTQ